MSTHDQESEISFTTPWEIFKPYFAYLAMFLGMGLISGSIVHVAQEDMREYALILMGIGGILFALGSYLNEVLFRTGSSGDDVLKYVILSFIVAIGIGMVSGSAQHFFDTPVFASYLAPIGIFVSSAAFAFRQGYVLHRKNWVFLFVLGFAFAAISHLGIRAYAETLPVSTGHHGEANEMTSDGDHHDNHGAELTAEHAH